MYFRDNFNITNIWWTNQYSITRVMMINILNRIGGVMGSVFASSAVDRGFELRSGLHKDYAIGICSTKEKRQRLVGSESE
jgi:hypothetical protein